MSQHPPASKWKDRFDSVSDQQRLDIVQTAHSPEGIEVLLVDDDPSVLDLAATVLERQNDSIRAFGETSAESALDRLSTAPDRFDCVVSDYEMPGMDGIDFLTAVRKEFRDLPFILYTGRGSEEVASEAISAGVTDYLQKQSGTEQYKLLVNRIENAVRRYRTEQTLELVKTRLVQLADSTGEVLWMFSADWEDLVFINSAYEDIWGRSIETLAENPRDFLNGIHADDREIVKEAMERLSNGETIDIEYRVVDPEENIWKVRSHGEPIINNNENVAFVSGITQDITEHRGHK